MPLQFIITSTQGSFDINEILDIDPFGWDSLEITLKRNRNWHGIFKEASLRLGFTCNGGGRESIEQVYNVFGIESLINVQINTRNSNLDEFELLYNGQLIMKSIGDTPELLFFNLTQQGITETVMNRMAIPIAIGSDTTLDDTVIAPGAFVDYDLNLHSDTITLGAEIDGGAFDELHNTQLNTLESHRIFVQNAIPLVQNELKATTANAKTINSARNADFPTLAGFGIPAFHDASGSEILVLPGVYNVQWDISGDLLDNNDGGNWSVTDGISLFLVYGPDLNTLKKELLGSIPGYSSTGPTVTSAFDFNSVANISLGIGDKLWLVWEFFQYHITSGGAGSPPFTVALDFEFDTSEVQLSIQSIVDPSTCKATAIYEVFQQISRSILDKSDAFRSQYYGRKGVSAENTTNGCGAFRAITSGALIRKLSQAEFPLTMSLEDIFSIYQKVDNVGLGVDTVDGDNQVIRVERQDFFYDASSTILTIDNVLDPVITEDNSIYVNTISVGYKKWEVEDNQGLKEFNTQHTYSATLTGNDNHIDAVANIIAGRYIIEFQRRKQFLPTTDSDWDEDWFMIALNRSEDGGGVPDTLDEAEIDENASNISGIDSPVTVYNIRETPHRILLKHLASIGAGLEKFAGRLLKFQKGEGNTNLAAEITFIDCAGMTAGILTEKSNQQWDDPNPANIAPLYKVFVHTFEAPLKFSEFQLIRDNPYEAVEYSETESDHIKCFLLELTYKHNEGMATFVLLEAAD